MAKRSGKDQEKEGEIQEGQGVQAEPDQSSPLEEMERWFEDAFRRPFFSPLWHSRLPFMPLGEITPSVDIFDDGIDVVVKAEVPGLRKEDIDVQLTEDTITISGVKHMEEKVEKKDYYRLERSFGSFSRKLRLPAEVERDKAKASFKDGVLEVRIPKTEAAKSKVKKVKIS
jgi:HSP20 family protein